MHEIFWREKGVGQMNVPHAPVKVVEERADHGGLAGAHLTGEKDEALPLHHAVLEHGKGFLVLLAQVQEPRRRREVERLLAEIVELLIHDQ